MADHEIIAELREIIGRNPEVNHNAAHPARAGTLHADVSGADVSDLVALETPAEGKPSPVALKVECGQESAFTEGDLDVFVEQMAAGRSDLAQQRRAAIVAFLDHYWGGAVYARTLAFNAGVGDDALSFAQTCRKAYYYEESRTLSAFALQRFIHRGAAITHISDTAKYVAAFDAVVAHGDRWQGDDVASRLDQLTQLTRCGGALFLADVDGVAPGDLHALLATRGCQPVADLDGSIHVYVKGPAVTVIVPIYNAADHLSHLLDSIVGATPGYPIRWMFVNDASSDERIAPMLREAEQHLKGRCLVVNQRENTGFLQTCNAAMAAAGNDDVILLNSDTIVYDGWARKLVEAAGSDDQIGTVTPLSNNASIYSCFEHISSDNNLNATLAQAELPVVTVPVGVGFCIYLKRQALQRVGMFDPVYGKGYGEETDLCLRMAYAGYRNVLTPQAFVYHAGGASMIAANVIESGEHSIPAHERIIQERYPAFASSIHDYMEAGTTRQIETQLSGAYIAHEATRRPSIAIVTQDGLFTRASGTEYHVRDLMHDLEHQFVFYTVSPVDPELHITGYVEGVAQTLTPKTADYVTLLKDLNPSLIHIHHLLGLPQALIEALIEWQGPKFFSIHDYFVLCPHYTLMNDHGVYCGVPEETECNRCAKALFNTGYADIRARRDLFQRLIDSVSLLISPSEAALAILRKGLQAPPEKARVIPHPTLTNALRQHQTRLPMHTSHSAGQEGGGEMAATLADEAPASPRRLEDQQDARIRLRVGIIGYPSRVKGTALLGGVIAACANDPIQFVAFGRIGDISVGSDQLMTTGAYTREELGERIAEHQVDVMLLCSPWPETFAYTLSESWIAQTPVIVGPLGAPAERVQATQAGLVLPDYQVETFAQALRNLLNDPALLARLTEAATRVTLDDTYDHYRRLYQRYIASQPASTKLFSLAPLAQIVVQVPSDAGELAPPPPHEDLAQHRRQITALEDSLRAAEQHNDELQRNLESAVWQLTWLEQSRGVRAIKRIRAASNSLRQRLGALLRERGS